MTPVITVDGPSGAGKGTLCRLLAQKLDYELLDSGAMYRIAAVAALDAELNLDDESAVSELAKNLDISFNVDGDDSRVILAGQDVSRAIRTERAGMAASKVAALPKVREALLERQRAFAKNKGLVADGRDMGTVVFPDAMLKIFLTASAEERARRRVSQLLDAGHTDVKYNDVLADIMARDDRDINRSSAPLLPAQDAIQLDSTELSISQVVEFVMLQLEKHGD